jgi:hypothetical protein
MPNPDIVSPAPKRRYQKPRPLVALDSELKELVARRHQPPPRLAAEAALLWWGDPSRSKPKLGAVSGPMKIEPFGYGHVKDRFST